MWCDACKYADGTWGYWDGYYGACTVCPPSDSCEQCVDDSGQCKVCKTGFKLINEYDWPECAPDENAGCDYASCLTCSDDGSTCNECDTGSGRTEDGRGCTSCPYTDGAAWTCSACEFQNAVQVCTMCEVYDQDGQFVLSFWDGDNQECATCPPIDNCAQCEDLTSGRCATCQAGFTADEEGVCVPDGDACVADPEFGPCSECSADSTRCLTCAPKYTFGEDGISCIDCPAGESYECSDCQLGADNQLTCNQCLGSYMDSDDPRPMYWSTVNAACVDCPQPGICTACDATGCTECNTEGYVLRAGKCVKVCEESDVSGCSQCSKEDEIKCAVCTDKFGLDKTATTCAKCPGYTSATAGYPWGCHACEYQAAVQVCTDCQMKVDASVAMFWNASKKACEKCPQNPQPLAPGICTKCNSSTWCQECAEGYKLVSGKCVKICQASPSGPCTQCSTADDTKCTNCTVGMGLASNQTTCELCPNGTTWKCNACSYDSIIKTQACTECVYRTNVKVAMYWNTTSRICSNCPQPLACTACNGAGVCTICADGYVMDAATKTCRRPCVANPTLGPCTRCNATDPFRCDTCITGYGLNSGSCQKCSGNCTACSFQKASASSASIEACTNCIYTASNGTTIPMYWQTNITPRKCTACPFPGLCTKCSGTGVCQNCTTGYSLGGSATYATCIKNCVYNATGCTLCNTTDLTKCARCAVGSGLDINKVYCEKCPSASNATAGWRCLNCAYSADIGGQACTTCRNTTLASVPMWFNKASRTCKRCPQPEACTACDGTGACTTCATGWTKKGSVCVKNCQAGVNNCATCSTTDTTKCTKCATGFGLDRTLTTCEACMSGSAWNCSTCAYSATNGVRSCSACVSTQSTATTLYAMWWKGASNICALCPNTPICSKCGTTGVCIACVDGYRISSGTCQRCTDTLRCLKCPTAVGTCTLCKTGFRVVSGKCVV